MRQAKLLNGSRSSRLIRLTGHGETNVIRVWFRPIDQSGDAYAIALGANGLSNLKREHRRSVLRRITSHPIANGNGTDVVSAIWGEPGVAVPLHTRMAMRGRLARIAEGGAS